MLTQIATYLFIAALVSLPLFAETGENTAAKQEAKDPDRRLPIVNPLFAPYQGQWYVEANSTEQRSAITATIPVQNYSGFAISESKTRSDYTDIRVGGQVMYGIHDRLAVGVRTRFLADRQVQTSSSGAFTSGSSGVSSRLGMYNPSFALQGRLLGIDRNEWHLNVIGMYSPGSVGGIGDPQTDVQAGLLLGKNSGFFSFGFVAFAIWSPETTSGTIKYRSTTAVSAEMILQAHFSPFFFNLLGGAFQYVDPSSASDAMSGKVRIVCEAEVGAEIQQNVFVKLSYGWLMPVSADYNSGGLQMTFRDHGGPAATLTIGARF
ncbi:MAG TPA: hypothetical protein PLF85_01425 [Turneriella sp.]|nr:hypothetical protein [Turneriella sp.]